MLLVEGFVDEEWGFRREVVSLREEGRDCEEFRDEGGAILEASWYGVRDAAGYRFRNGGIVEGSREARE